jgi:hypothetical protein
MERILYSARQTMPEAYLCGLNALALLTYGDGNETH